MEDFTETNRIILEEAKAIKEAREKNGFSCSIKKYTAKTGRLMVTLNFCPVINISKTKTPNYVTLDYNQTACASKDNTSECAGQNGRCFMFENRGYYCKKHEENKV